MSIETLRDALPDYAKDTRLNLSAVLGPVPGMTDVQIWGTAVACAIATRNATVQQAVMADATGKLSDAEMQGAKTAASVMAMNNIYYRFLHMLERDDYMKSPAGLRMNGLAQHGADKKDFELWALAVSAINGCGMCIQSHQQKLEKDGVSSDIIRAAVRIAAVLQAAAVTLEAEHNSALNNLRAVA